MKKRGITIGPVRTQGEIRDAAKKLSRGLGPKTAHAEICLTVIAWPYKQGFCTCGGEPLPENAFEKAFDLGQEYAEKNVGVAIDASKGLDYENHSAEYAKGWDDAMAAARDIAYHMPFGSEWQKGVEAVAKSIAEGTDDSVPF